MSVSDTMSDTSDQVPEYVDRTEEETVLLERQFKGEAGYKGYAYVAPPAPGYDVRGVWHHFSAQTRSGYAAHGLALHQQLLDLLPTQLVPVHGGGLDIAEFPDDRAELLTSWMSNAHGVGLPEALICSLPPDPILHESMKGMTRSLVDYVAGPECTIVSPFAASMVNGPDLAALWCVSEFTYNAYVAGGADLRKVRYIRPAICDGIWRDMFKPIDAIAWHKRDVFVFGTLGTWHERKGYRDLLRAYFSAFKRSDNVELHIRTSSLDSRMTIKRFEEKVISEIAEVAKEFGDTNYPDSKRQPKIKLITGTALSDREVIEWLGSLDCYVNASYAEGLGIPQTWAMAQGVPLVTSDFGTVGQLAKSAQLDLGTVYGLFMSEPSRVPSSMRSHSPIWHEYAQWGTYDVTHLAAAMTGQYMNGHSANSALARWTRELFSFDACRPLLREALGVVMRNDFNGWR